MFRTFFVRTFYVRTFFVAPSKCSESATHDGEDGAAAVDVVLRELERRRNLVGLASDESDRRNRNSDRVDP